MLFCKDSEKIDEKIRISRLLKISDLKYKEIFAAIDKDGNGGISRSGHILNFFFSLLFSICPRLVRCFRNCSYVYSDTITLGAEVLGHHQNQLTQTLIVFVKKTHTFFALILD